ncbi:MAG: hypothetical protein KKE23_01800 [Nanoarchaeota archaeon]|nr:hypothetical protein [Nanoarchaeota archaeon]
MKVSKGDTLYIGGEKYNVIKVMREIDRYDSKNKKLVGQHMEIELSNSGEDATHILKIYSDDKIILMNRAKPQKGIIFNYIHGKNIPLDSIKVENK